MRALRRVGGLSAERSLDSLSIASLQTAGAALTALHLLAPDARASARGRPQRGTFAGFSFHRFAPNRRCGFDRFTSRRCYVSFHFVALLQTAGAPCPSESVLRWRQAARRPSGARCYI